MSEAELLPPATKFNWTPKAEAVALALAEGKTWDTIQKETGSAKTTIARWTRELEFQARVDAHLEAIITEARRHLQRNVLNAARKVVQIMEHGYASHGVRLQAAKDILDRVGVKVPEKPDGNSNTPGVTIQINAIDYRAAIAALTAGPVIDSAPSGEGESVIDGAALGQDDHGRRD